VEACVHDTPFKLKETGFMKIARGNGWLEAWSADSTPGIARLYRIDDCLRTREARG